MHPFSHPVTLVSAVLTLSLLNGCMFSTNSTQTAAPVASLPSATVQPSLSPSPTPMATPPSAQLLTESAAQAAQAISLAQSAQSRDDWALVASRWERAIALLEQVPDQAPEQAQAEQRLATYRRSFTQAQAAANRPISQEPVRLSRPETPTTTSSSPSPGASPTSTPTNVSPELALAMHLRQTGARMYAAYWCGYCRRQRELFGPEAVEQLEIVECDPRGTNPQVDRCRAAQVGSFPTWEINGQTYPGMRSLNDLAEMSGYDGPRTFRN